MDKIMTLEVLSSIKGAQASEAVDELFQVIKDALPVNNTTEIECGVSIDDLRSDEVINSSAKEKELIKANFPKEKNGYLVVSKVIED